MSPCRARVADISFAVTIKLLSSCVMCGLAEERSPAVGIVMLAVQSAPSAFGGMILKRRSLPATPFICIPIHVVVGIRLRWIRVRMEW